jgi:hypothetical protein
MALGGSRGDRAKAYFIKNACIFSNPSSLSETDFKFMDSRSLSDPFLT